MLSLYQDVHTADVNKPASLSPCSENGIYNQDQQSMDEIAYVATNFHGDRETAPELSKREFAQSVPVACPLALDISYPGSLLTAVLYIALLLAMFLVALDMSVISTAIPTITAQFHSVDQVGWYGSAFFMCLAAFQTFWGKAYKYFPLKIVFLICIGTFEIGSLIVAVAPNSATIVVGRAIQGAGGAGITSGCYIICVFIIKPKHLARILSLFGSVWSCSSVLGPVLGGIFAEDISWRWCFWINLPIGGTTMVIVLLFFKTPSHSRVGDAKFKEIPFLFDLGGVVILIGASTCLLLALEDGGVTIVWSNSVPLGLLIGFSLLIIMFAVWEWKQGESAMVIPRIMKRRTIFVLSLFTLCAQGASFARTYNLPIYFQAVQGLSPTESGIRTLPTVLSISIFSFLSSLLVSKVGYYQPFLWAGGIFMTIGSATIYTLDIKSRAAHYIGYQVLAGIGGGLVIQLPVIVGQAFAARIDVAVTVAIILFCQFVGGTIGISAAQNIMNNVIVSSLPMNNPRISSGKVLAAGSNGLRQAFLEPDDLNTVVNAYMTGLKAAWVWSIVLSGLAFLISFGAEWKSIRVDQMERTEHKTDAESPSA